MDRPYGAGGARAHLVGEVLDRIRPVARAFHRSGRRDERHARGRSLVTAVFVLSLVPLVASEVALGLWLGARHATLDSRNAAQIATSFGAIVYMLVSLALITLVVAVEAWPVAALLRGAHTEAPGGAWLVTLAVALGWLASVPVFAVARRRGLRAWARLGV